MKGCGKLSSFMCSSFFEDWLSACLEKTQQYRYEYVYILSYVEKTMHISWVVSHCTPPNVQHGSHNVRNPYNCCSTSEIIWAGNIKKNFSCTKRRWQYSWKGMKSYKLHSILVFWNGSGMMPIVFLFFEKFPSACCSYVTLMRWTCYIFVS